MNKQSSSSDWGLLFLIQKNVLGQIAPENTKCPNGLFISNVRNMFGPLCQQKGIKLVIEEKPVANVVIVDHIRLNQITLNLLSNAVKYTPEGGTVI
jgi:signal transduction histidine kinase